MTGNQYLVFTEEAGAMTGMGNMMQIIHVDSDKSAIKWAKKYFKKGNSTIWKSVTSLVLIKKFKNKEVELLKLDINYPDQKNLG